MKKVLIISGSIILCLLAALAAVVAVSDIEGGTNGITLVFESADASAEYDGTPLTAPEWKLTSGTLEEGHVAKVSVTGSQTVVGEGKNTLSVTIEDEDGEDVTERYNIKLTEGTLSVYKRNVEFVANSTQKVYDGTSLKCDGYQIIGGSILDGHRAVASYAGELTDVGVVESRVTLAIFDESGNDVSENYELVSHPGTLTVVKRRLSLKSPSVDRIYNGTALSSEKISIIEGSLAPEHEMISHSSAKLTGVGELSNKFTVTISDLSGKDVTDNYDVVYNYGVLRVLPSRITVFTGSDTKVYDGMDFSCDTFSITSGSVAVGENLSAVFSTVARNVGIYENKATFSVVNAAGIDTTKNYIITVVTGTVEVLERSILLASADDSKIYDGLPLEKHEISFLEGTELANGHSLSVIYTGSQNGQGTSENEFSAVVYDETGEDVTSNYDIKTFFGELTVSKVTITVRSPDLTKAYDGTALTGNIADLDIMGAVLPGHRMELRMTGERISAGVSENTFEIKIFAENGIEVTDNYEIVKSYGKLTVTKRSLVITSPTIDVLYDATEKFSRPEDCTVTGDIAPGDILTLVLPQRHTNVYEGKNTVIVKLERGGVDVSENYELTVVEGDFVVHPITLRIGTETKHKIYDKIALLPPTSPGWYYISDERPLDGHTVGEVEFTASRRDAGKVENRVVIEIYDGTDNVSRNYNIEYSYGYLIVTPFKIVVKSGSAEKDYDGTALEYDNWELITPSSENELPVGDRLEVTVFGERISVGENPNSFSVQVRNEYGLDVSANYEIEKHEGDLVVKGTDIEENKPVTVMKVKATKTERVYLRYMSYKDLTGKLEANPYNGMLDLKYSYNYLASSALRDSGVDAQRIEIENYLGDMYVLPAYPVMQEGDYPLPTNDVIYSNNHDGTYSLLYYSYSGYGENLSPVPTEYRDEEVAYREHVYDTYLDIDDTTAGFMGEIINEYQFSKYDVNIVGEVASYIQNAAEYDLSVANDLDKEKNVVIAFLKTYKKGVCRHYAAAATAMFRTLGIPARYTVGFAAEAKANEWSEVSTTDAHAWVEVYFDGIGWIAVEVTGGSGGGTEPPIPSDRVLKLKPVTEYHEYTGDVYTHSGKLQGWAAWEKQGYTADIVVDGSSKEVGWTEVTIVSFKLFDPEGKDVTSEFKVIRGKGRMQIYEHEIRIASLSARKEYDGKILTKTGSDSYKIISNTYQGRDHNVSVVCTGKIRDVGTVTNYFNVKITDANGKDITDSYRVYKEYGLLEVYARKLHITLSSVDHFYDGNALVSNAYEVNQAQFATGHFIQDIVITGSQTNVGTSENKITYITIYGLIDDALVPVDVTRNYVITTTNGKLTVKPWY